MKHQKIYQYKNLSIEHTELLNSYIVRKGAQTTILYAPALKAHCYKYGIPLKTWGNLCQYLMSPTCYIPQSITGYN